MLNLHLFYGLKELQADNPQIAARIEFGLYLAFTRARSPLYTRLSLNITREVFTYIGSDHLYLGTIQGNKLVAYDLTSESMQVTVPSISLNLSSTGFIMLDREVMLVVGGSSKSLVNRVNIWTGKITEEAAMSECRAWPGILKYKEFVWVFGGNTGPALSTMERFRLITRTWRNGPRMLSPKVCFTPFEYHDLIYLAEISAQKKQLEVLNPLTDEYTLLPLQLHGAQFGSISFIESNTLYICSYSGNVGTWVLGSQDAELRELMKTDIQCYTNGSPIIINKFVYWLGGNFGLIRFDLTTSTIAPCKTVEIKK